ncbi:MAG TPA: hypothetical protein VM936_03455 [Pyrinomonadaceae bacterium]|nr:hypothetical protein [Pyrinomonadaceae bacterium]
MADSSDSKRLWRRALIVAGAGLLVLVPLWFLYARVSGDAIQRRVIAVNEADALYTLELIAAAEHVHLQSYGEYGTIKQLNDSGILQTEFGGDPPARAGYAYAVKLTPKTGAQPPAYSVNADPLNDKGREATGRRHFYIGSEAVGVRVNEDRPATAADKPRLSVDE